MHRAGCVIASVPRLTAVKFPASGREDSPTYGMINEVYLGDPRPAFVVIPIGVWHGLQNLGTCDALVLNMTTRAYDYKDPDHWRLPYDTDEIPYTWANRGAGNRLRADARATAG